MSKPGTPNNSNTLLLRRQLTELTKRPVEGFSAGLSSSPSPADPSVDPRISQLLSVISLLSSDTPNLDSPANVDAAKQVRTDIEGPEVDSDSDFNPGTYVPEPVKKRKRGSTSTAPTARQKGGSGSKRARSMDVTAMFEMIGDINLLVLQRRRVDSNEQNPLLQYFAEENLDLHSESECSDDESDDMRDEREEDEDEDESDEDNPVPSKMLSSATRREPRIPPPPDPANKRPNINVQSEDDNSVTESDSEAEDGLPLIPAHVVAQTVSKKPLPDKNQVSEESVTEPESDMEELASTSGNTQDESSGSETESDEEYELGDLRLKPRPGFPLRGDQTLRGPLYLDAEKKVAIPAAINTYLRDYQRDGVQFFYRQYAEGRGGLLGDDMGLVISFLSAIMQKKGIVTDKNRRRKHVSRLQDQDAWKKRRELPPADETWPTCLIIAPSTVVHNWQREFQTWGYFEVGMYNGSQKEREPVLNDFKMGRLDVVLTTFDLARKDIDILDTLPWTCIFVDEVHRVKNVTSKITVAYHQFACERRFGLTGTTIQNSYKEMWTILDWTNPGRLGTARQWHGFIVKPLTTGQSAGASEDERAKALVVALVLRDKLLPKFFLRRTKDIIRSQVLEILLKEWRKDPTNKVLIFTKSVKLLEMLEFHLKSRGLGFLKLDGATKQSDRMPMIDQFHNDPDVFIFLISTLAGGTGLNLTGANKVVIFDPNWNPAHDLQAMDRAFRFGQTRDVSVYRLLGAGSVEELIYARQIYKQQQMAIGYEASVQTRYFEGIQGDTGKKGELFGIENIFKLHEDKLSTKMAIEKANLAELDWALANMGGGPTSKKQEKSGRDDWLGDAETRGPKDKEDIDAIQKTLSSIGVKYSHHNDQIIAPSRIEEERTKKTLLVCLLFSLSLAPALTFYSKTRRRLKSKPAKGGSPEKGSPKPLWPPMRQHHRPQQTPEQQYVDLLRI
ncbi:hypothetical protein C0993_012456 [Termitomyces sp. T159_Od127]|nr:hypothetical protein C0993_012456 [Termitomyces sp. T159_Od127]